MSGEQKPPPRAQAPPEGASPVHLTVDGDRERLRAFVRGLGELAARMYLEGAFGELPGKVPGNARGGQ
jgi:hypothetical protein